MQMHMQFFIFDTQESPKCVRAANSFQLSSEYVSVPREIQFPVSLTVGAANESPSHAYGYFYPPKVHYVNLNVLYTELQVLN